MSSDFTLLFKLFKTSTSFLSFSEIGRNSGLREKELRETLGALVSRGKVIRKSDAYRVKNPSELSSFLTQEEKKEKSGHSYQRRILHVTEKNMSTFASAVENLRQAIRKDLKREDAVPGSRFVPSHYLRSALPKGYDAWHIETVLNVMRGIHELIEGEPKPKDSYIFFYVIHPAIRLAYRLWINGLQKKAEGLSALIDPEEFYDLYPEAADAQGKYYSITILQLLMHDPAVQRFEVVPVTDGDEDEEEDVHASSRDGKPVYEFYLRPSKNMIFESQNDSVPSEPEVEATGVESEPNPDETQTHPATNPLPYQTDARSAMEEVQKMMKSASLSVFKGQSWYEQSELREQPEEGEIAPAASSSFAVPIEHSQNAREDVQIQEEEKPSTSNRISSSVDENRIRIALKEFLENFDHYAKLQQTEVISFAFLHGCQGPKNLEASPLLDTLVNMHIHLIANDKKKIYRVFEAIRRKLDDTSELDAFMLRFYCACLAPSAPRDEIYGLSMVPYTQSIAIQALSNWVHF